MSDPERDDDSVSNALAMGWGAGAAATSLSINLFGLMLMPFMTSRLGMSAALAGGLISVNKLLGVALDPLVGWLSDRTSTRIGRRRPYILAGSLLLPLSLVALFAPPGFIDTLGEQTVYFAAAVFLFGVAYSIIRVPYLTMSAEMTSSRFVRARMIAFKITAIAAGTLFGNALAPILIDAFGSGRASYGWTALILAIIAMLAGLACFFATRHARFTTRTSTPGPGVLPGLRSMLGNGPFSALIGGKSLFMLGATFQGSCSAYFVLFVMHQRVGLLGVYYLIVTLLTMASQPLWLRLVRAQGKRVTYMLSTLLFAIWTLGWLWVATHPQFAFLIGMAVGTGIAMGGTQLAFESMLPDIMGLDAQRTGLRREGIFASVASLMEKVTSALGIAAVGLYLNFAGFLQGTGDMTQPASVVLAITLAVSAVPAATALLSIAIIQRWGLHDHVAATPKENDGAPT